MGQKVNPISLRLGINRTWHSQWYASRDYASRLRDDFRIRAFIKEKLYHAGISRVEIERASSKVRVNVYTARPGLVIGKKGAGIDDLKDSIQNITGAEVFLNIQDIRKPETDAQLVAENIAVQLEKRIAFRRAMKKAIGNALKFGAKGIRVFCAGRLSGAEIARREQYKEGRVPLHTLRADIDYGFAEAKTTYGIIGVKVILYKGETVGKVGSEKFIPAGGLHETKFGKLRPRPAAQV